MAILPYTPLETAALALYALCRPEDALPWDGLTTGQQERYRRRVTLAARMSDVVAMKAALEAGAAGLAAHAGLTLRDCTPQQRMGFRFDAIDTIRAFEDALIDGNAEQDQRTLVLAGEELQGLVDTRHAQALAEDTVETKMRDARLDIARYSQPTTGSVNREAGRR